VKVRLYTGDNLFVELCEEWGDLLADSAADCVFMTCAWQSAWWKAYQPGQVWAPVVHGDDGRLHGIAPWFRAVEDDGTRTIYPVGCVDVTDYLDVIARRGHEDAVFAALADFLAEHADEFDNMRLCNIPQDSPGLALLPGLLADRGFSVSVDIEDVCPVVTLPERWEDYVAGLDKKRRHELRRKLRRAQGAGSAVDWYIVGPDHNLEDELDRFLRLMAASSEEKALFLQHPVNEAFFRAVVPQAAEQGWLQLAFLTVNGEAAASYLNFTYGDRVMVYNSGHDPAQHGRLSPGIVLMARLIEHAIVQRRAVFDFLRGDEPYKYDLGGQDTHVYRLTVQAGAGR
jgi:CelD/BcsL family acetyltransferase involved in cellulose biosynthesis